MEFRITDTNVYGDSNQSFFFAYEGYEKEEKIVSGINYVEYEETCIPEKTALVMLEKNQEQLKQMPKVTELPEPLQNLVLRQYDSLSGMMFLENDDEFWKKYTEKDLMLLKEQIAKYRLKSCIVLEDNRRDKVIICYMSLSSRFNFVGIR